MICSHERHFSEASFSSLEIFQVTVASGAAAVEREAARPILGTGSLEVFVVAKSLDTSDTSVLNLRFLDEASQGRLETCTLLHEL